MSSSTRFENGFCPKPRTSTVGPIGFQRTLTPPTRRRRSGTVRAPDSPICFAVMTVTALAALEIAISVFVAAGTFSWSSPNSVTTPIWPDGATCADVANVNAANRIAAVMRMPRSLPIRRLVILQELPPHVPAGVDAIDDGIDDARGAVDDVEGR